MKPEQLQALGFNLSEAKIYLALLKLGFAKAGQISKQAQLNRTTTYDSLETLINKGMVSFVISGNRKIFSPAAPDRLLQIIKDNEQVAKQLLPELKNMLDEDKELQQAFIYKGKNGIKCLLDDILRQKEYVEFGSSGKFLDIMNHDFIKFQARKKELKVRSRVLMGEKARNEDAVKTSWGEFRFIDDKFSSPLSTFVYGPKVATIVWADMPIATVILDRKVADSFRNYFEIVWKSAKK